MTRGTGDKVCDERDKWDRLDEALDRVSRIASGIAVAPCLVLLTAWLVVVTAYVIGRYAFTVAWLFVEEYTGYYLVLLTYLSLAYGLRSRVHIRAEVVIERLPQKVRSTLDLLTGILAVLIVCYLTWRSGLWAAHGLQLKVHSLSALYTLMWPIYLFIPIGLGLFALVLSIDVYRSIIKVLREYKVKQQYEENGQE